MKKWQWLIMAFLLFLPATGWSQGSWTYSPTLERYTYTPDPNSPLGRGEHPRLYFTADTLDDLQTKVREDYLDMYQIFVDWVDRSFDDPIPDKYYERRYGGALDDSYAFVYLMGRMPGITYDHLDSNGGLTLYREKAIQGMLGYSARELDRYNNQDDQNPYYPHGGHCRPSNILGVSHAYDWLHAELTDTERRSIVDFLLMVSGEIERRFPGDYGYWPPWWPALAFYGDGLEDEAAQRFVDSFYQQELSETPPIWGLNYINHFARDKGGWRWYGAYLNYTSVVVGTYDRFSEWYTATGEDYFNIPTPLTEPHFWKFPQYILYRIKPAKAFAQYWKIIKLGATSAYEHQPIKTYEDELVSLGQILKRTDPDMAALNRWLINNRTGERMGGTSHAGLYMFLHGDRTVAPKSPAELGLPGSQYFEGLGHVIMRTGFDSEDDTAITFLAPNFNLGGRDAGGCYIQGFTIDKYGPLALYQKDRIRDRYNRTNIMRFLDPQFIDRHEDNNAEGYYDGGIKNKKTWYRHYGLSSRIEPGSVWDDGGMKTVHLDEGGRLDYMAADYTEYYVTENKRPSDLRPPRVKSYEREFVYLKPDVNTQSDYIVVFDRIEAARDDIEKRWEICSSYEPQIQGDGSVIVTSPPGQEAWHHQFSGANQIIISNNVGVDPYSGSAHPEAHGRLFVKTLLPADVIIARKGGVGYEFPWDDGEFKEPISNQMMYVGTYHTDVISQGPARENFLHVMQTADTNNAEQSGAMVHTELVVSTGTGSHVEGAFITASPGQKNAVVMFAKHFEVLYGNITYTVDTGNSSPTRHVICDMAAGNYKVTINGEWLENREFTVADARTNHYKAKMAEDAGRGLFEVPAQPGSYTVTIQNAFGDSSPPSPPGNLLAQGLSDTEIQLTWDPATDLESDIKKYRVYRDSEIIGITIETSYVDTGLTELTSYLYDVIAVNGAGMQSVKASTEGVTLPDTTPPTIISVVSAGDPNLVKVVFSESMEQASSANPANYAIDQGIAVQGAELQSDTKTVYLQVTTLSKDVTYTLTVNNVRDRAQTPNAIQANTRKTFTHYGENLRPVAESGSFEVREGDVYYGQMVASDREDAPLVYSIVDWPDHGELIPNQNTGAFTYVPRYGYDGPDRFTFKVNDGTWDSAGAEMRITVRPEDYVPPQPETPRFKNVFNPKHEVLTIRYAAGKGRPEVTVYDRRGQEIQGLTRFGSDGDGPYVVWDGRNADGSIVSSGVYIVLIKFDDEVVKKKIVVLK